jgi:hypothetical protein
MSLHSSGCVTHDNDKDRVVRQKGGNDLGQTVARDHESKGVLTVTLLRHR